MRVGDFLQRTRTVFGGQEFCGFKLTFRFCDFLDMNLQDFVWKFFSEEPWFFFKTAHIGPARNAAERRNFDGRRIFTPVWCQLAQ